MFCHFARPRLAACATSLGKRAQAWVCAAATPLLGVKRHGISSHDGGAKEVDQIVTTAS